MENLVAVLKALADENRLKIVKLLLENDFCVGALSRRLEISKPAVSQHLQILRKANIAYGEKRGYYTHYWINRELLKEVGLQIEEIATLTKDENSDCPSEKFDCCKKNKVR